ncbi:MAG: heme-binding domain-containing protein [Anaerolineae bacterium]|nr:heme-binding domain-containing protein [Anaerolineae bacterium]
MPTPPPVPLTRRWWMRTLVINAALLLVFVVAIQAIPIPRENPPVQREPQWDSPQTRELAAGACFDCHSNETAWPWYARVAPSAWVVWYDVTEGRQALNFSEWEYHAGDEFADPDDPFAPKPLSERIAQAIRDGSMPPGTYRLAHAAARLSDAEKEALIAGLVRTVQASQDR